MAQPTPANSQTGCVSLDRLIGSRVAVGNAELRFPILTRQIFRKLPAAVPPIEGAFFYDAGVAFNSVSQLHWTRCATPSNPNCSPENVRVPLRSYGLGIRAKDI